MRILTRLVLVVLAPLAGLTGLAAPASGETAPQQVTITPDGGPTCVGDVRTVGWSPPADVAGLTGYRVVQSVTTINPPWTFTDDVRPEQTTLSFTASFGV